MVHENATIQKMISHARSGKKSEICFIMENYILVF